MCEFTLQINTCYISNKDSNNKKPQKLNAVIWHIFDLYFRGFFGFISIKLENADRTCEPVNNLMASSIVVTCLNYFLFIIGKRKLFN